VRKAGSGRMAGSRKKGSKVASQARHEGMAVRPWEAMEGGSEPTTMRRVRYREHVGTACVRGVCGVFRQGSVCGYVPM